MIPLSNKEKRKLFVDMLNLYSIDLRNMFKKEQIFKLEKEKVLVAGNKPIVFYKDNIPYPTLQLLVLVEDFDIPYVIVDEGAKPHILNGADIFRPGVVEYDEKVTKDKAVIVVSEDKKLLCIGKSLYNGSELKNISKGKIILNLHYYGDKIFDLEKQLSKK